MTTVEFIHDVFARDENPASDDDTPYAAGQMAVSVFSQEELPDLVRDAIRLMPASTLGDFIDGICSRTTIPHIDQLLLDALPRASDVTSGCTVVRFLRESHGVSATILAESLLRLLAVASSDAGKNALAYGLYCLGSDPQVRAMIQHAVPSFSEDHLTAYARECLTNRHSQLRGADAPRRG